jgi:hypothetical protein
MSDLAGYPFASCLLGLLAFGGLCFLLGAVYTFRSCSWHPSPPLNEEDSHGHDRPLD